MVKNLKGHIILKCEASTLKPYRAYLERHGWTLCFNDCEALCCLARLGVEGTIRQLQDLKKKRKKLFGTVQREECRLPFLKLLGEKQVSVPLLPRRPQDISPGMKNRTM